MPALYLEPRYGRTRPPCRDACPTGENVRGWLAEVHAGRYRAAWELIVRDNPLPAVTARVCAHPCEDACERGRLDRPVNIRAVERILGDLALSGGWSIAAAAPSGRRVLIAGAGPSGLAAAWHLARRGHTAVIFEPGARTIGDAGAERVPRALIDAEIARIEELGVDIRLNRQITDLLRDKAEGRFDAVFLAAGATDRCAGTGEFEERAGNGLLRTVPGIEIGADGATVTGPDMQTGYPGIFAAVGTRDFAAQLAQGKKAAHQIDAFLRVLTRRTWGAFSGSTSMPIPPGVAGANAGAGVPGGEVRAVSNRLDDSAPDHQVTLRSEAERCLSCVRCFDEEGRAGPGGRPA